MTVVQNQGDCRAPAASCGVVGPAKPGALPYWKPLTAGLALAVVVLATFVISGHGVGATGASTRLVAWIGTWVAPQATGGSAYLGSLAAQGQILNSWITWQVLGVFLGAWLSAVLARRWQWQVEGENTRQGRGNRLFRALLGGALAGFGARIADGCTSSVGLSGTAMLSVAGFVFLGAFFVAGLVVSRLTGGGVR